jgi:hypothetical protein
VLLAFLHPVDIVAGRYVRLLAGRLGRGETEQPRDLVPVGEAVGDPLPEDGAELSPEGGVLLRLVRGQVAEKPEQLDAAAGLGHHRS